MAEGTLFKTLAVLLLAGVSLVSLTACSAKQSAEAWEQPAADRDWVNVQLDVVDAAGSVQDALESEQSLAQIRKQLPGYLEHRVESDEQASLTRGSCGLDGDKDFTLTVSGGTWLAVYTSRTGQTAHSDTLGRTALISKACGIYG